MFILDTFTFKNSFTKYFSVRNVEEIVNFARRAILSQAKRSASGSEKKAVVDSMVSDLILGKAATCPNELVVWCAKSLSYAVPVITQQMYNFLKEEVKDL